MAAIGEDFFSDLENSNDTSSFDSVISASVIVCSISKISNHIHAI